jgi:hypothetical protein
MCGDISGGMDPLPFCDWIKQPDNSIATAISRIIAEKTRCLMIARGCWLVIF